MKLLLFILAPFQACWIIINVLFTILFSPIGPKYAQTTTGNLQYSTANAALSNVCLVGMGMAILLPGLLRTNWSLKGGEHCAPNRLLAHTYTSLSSARNRVVQNFKIQCPSRVREGIL